MDSEIFSAIQKRDKLYKKFKKSGLETDKDLFRAAKISVQKAIKQKKKEYFHTKIEENTGNSKELWKVLKSLGLNSNKVNQSKISLKKDGVIQFDPAENANIFKEFYSELAESLVNKLPDAPNKYNKSTTEKFYSNIKKTNNDFEFHNVSTDTIKKILSCLDSTKAPGLDEISSKFLKDGAEVLALPICNLINLSLKLSCFPDQCKIAKLKPLFKKGSKTDPKNYRPISLLPLVSKIIEKTIHLQTQDYLNRNGLLYKYQSGFRANFSTDSCLAQLTDFILKGMDKGMHTGMILVDLQKAFDTLDHNILLEKMECIGFNKKVIKWFHSYLLNRKFFVSLENIFSDAGLLKCGVPQGSILGPLLFLIYINDLPQSLNETGSYLYADDTCIFYQHKDIKEIERILNKEFSSLCEWFIDNKLSIHFGEDKTKSILFSRKKEAQILNISYDGHSIKQHNTVEYLGCLLDSNLSGESMALSVLKKIHSKLTSCTDRKTI